CPRGSTWMPPAVALKLPHPQVHARLKRQPALSLMQHPVVRVHEDRSALDDDLVPGDRPVLDDGNFDDAPGAHLTSSYSTSMAAAYGSPRDVWTASRFSSMAVWASVTSAISSQRCAMDDFSHLA